MRRFGNEDMGAIDGTLNQRQTTPYLQIFHNIFHFNYLQSSYYFFINLVHYMNRFMQLHIKQWIFLLQIIHYK